MTENCLFCQWGSENQNNLWGNDYFIARFDRFPVNPGHFIIIPRRHLVGLNDLGQEEWMALQQSIKDAQKAASLTDLKALYRRYIDSPLNDKSVKLCIDTLNSSFIGKFPDGWNIGVNDGRAAGRTVDHLHVQCIPRFAGDVSDPRGGIRNVIPEKGNYKK